MTTAVSLALIDGVAVPLAQARIALTDEGFVRGDGAFETIGVWDGHPFRLPEHFARLAYSLAALGLPAPDIALLEAETATLLHGLGPADAVLRCVVTGSGTRVLTLTPRQPLPPARHLVPQQAPWIRPLGTYPLAGAKTISYAANMAAGRAARREGGDDALLVSLEGYVLEGPTFGVLWVEGEVVRAPARDLGIVASISRQTVLEAARTAGLRVEEGWHGLGSLERASEFLICSATRPLLPVGQIGATTFGPVHPVGDLLAKALEAARRGTPYAPP